MSHTGPGQAKIVNDIGMSVEEAHTAQPVTLAVFAITSKMTKMLELFLDERTVPGPTLNELLKASGLSLETVGGAALAEHTSTGSRF